MTEQQNSNLENLFNNARRPLQADSFTPMVMAAVARQARLQKLYWTAAGLVLLLVATLLADELFNASLRLAAYPGEILPVVFVWVRAFVFSPLIFIVLLAIAGYSHLRSGLFNTMLFLFKP